MDGVLACPRCRGAIAIDGARCVCGACHAEFPFAGGIPRLADDPRARDPRMEAEWTAQHHAREIYVNPDLIANSWERLVLPAVVRPLASVPGPVLDVGCGVGHLGRALHDAGVAVELVGLDFQGELLEHATTGYVARVEADIHRLPLRDGSFRGAIAANTLHHAADPVLALRELRRVLGPDGILVGYDPRALAPLERVKKALRRHDAAFTEDHKAFRVDEYRALFEQAGFRIDELRTRDHLGALASAGLDLLQVGKTGLAGGIARALAGIDRALERADRGGSFGLMVLAVARA